MGGGSFGMSKSRSGSTATESSSGYGYNGSESSDVSQAISQAVSGSSSTSTQTLANQDIFSQLFGGATTAANKYASNASEVEAAARQLFTGGTGFLESLQSNAGSEYLTSRLEGNQLLDEQISQLGTDINDYYSNTINPNLRRNSAMTGTLGGGRQGVAEGLSARAQGEQFTEGALKLRTDDMAMRDQAANDLLTGTNASAATGIAGLSSVLGLAQEGAGGAGLDAFSQLSQILGQQQTLTNAQSTSSSVSTSQQIAEAFSKAFGENFSQSQGSSSSFGRSNSFNMSGYVGVGGS